MDVSGKTELSNLIPEIWAANMYDELRNQLNIANVFSREYEGEIREMGDTVRVNTIVAPTGEILTNDKDVFNSETMQVTQNVITVNKRASAAFEFTSLGQLQSQRFEQDAQEALIYAIRRQVETSIRDALIAGGGAITAPVAASDYDVVDVAGQRTRLSGNLVPNTNRYLWADPQYYGDLLQKTTFTSSDFRADTPVSSGFFKSPLYGFLIAESDILAADTSIAAHPSALQMVMQQEIRLKISDLHPQNKYGFLMSADLVFDYQVFDSARIEIVQG